MPVWVREDEFGLLGEKTAVGAKSVGVEKVQYLHLEGSAAVLIDQGDKVRCIWCLVHLVSGWVGTLSPEPLPCL